MYPSRRISRFLAPAGAAFVGLLLAAPAAAAASVPTGAFAVGPATLAANRVLLPGDHLALGWALQVAGAHPAATYYLSHLTVTIPVACAAGGHDATITLRMADGHATIPADSTSWTPTSNPAAAAGYQFSSPVPDLCGGGLMLLRKGSTRGALYSGTVSATDATHPVRIAFHAVDAHTSGLDAVAHGDLDHAASTKHSVESPTAWAPHGANIDCANAHQNAGLSVCRSAWTPGTQVSAAPRAPATTGGGGTGTGAGGGTGTGGTGTGTGGTGTGTGGTGTGTGTGTGGTGVGLPGVPGVGGVTAGTGGVTVSAGTGGVSVTAGGLKVHVRLPAPLPVINPVPAAVAPAPAAPVGPPAAAAPVPTSTAGPGPSPVVGGVLGPVPVLAPSTIGDVLARTSTVLPWRWFGALALVDGLLVVMVVRRRRRSRNLPTR